MKRWALLAVVLVGTGAAATTVFVRAAAQTVTIDEVGDQVQTVPRGRSPVFAGRGDTGALYRFATEQESTLAWMPCFCGCGDLGHGSNRACYVKQESPDRITDTSHAAT